MPKNENTAFISENLHNFKHFDAAFDCLHMINLNEFVPNIYIDLRYAGNDNFMHTPMYPFHTAIAYARKPVAEALKAVQEALNAKGLSLKIWDAYRPYAVTVAFWKRVHDERYVANPANGSGHNRGIAVDVTLVQLHNGMPLDMGTDFDNFTDSAHGNFSQFPSQILANRKLLQDIMTTHGFKALPTEWWHFSWINAANFPVLNIPFKKMKKIVQ
ncbi:M15 family metallopeptidase [Hydrotalea flava]|uniref:M15 family metallopeptidase n=1 Tax=Hydrotalea flava TaxID=714549 RepID=UPI00142E96A3|nr:M15 family metallopeptidase [Hydrotalea flava]